MKHALFAVALLVSIAVLGVQASADSTVAATTELAPVDGAHDLEPLGDDPGNGKKGTGTCHDSKRKIIECFDNTTYKRGRKLCYANRRASNFHWQTKAPTCFQILNGDVSWP